MNLKCRFKYFTTIWPGKAECLAYWHWRHYRLQKAAWTCSWCENPSFSLSTIFQSKSALIRKTNYDKVHIWLSVLSVSNDEGLLFIKKKTIKFQCIYKSKLHKENELIEHCKIVKNTNCNTFSSLARV